MRFHELILQARGYAAGGHGDAFDLRVALREVLCEEDIGEFGVPVAGPGVVRRHWRSNVCEDEAALGRDLVAGGAEVDDADVGIGFLGGFAESGEENGGQEGVADMVSTELDFVAFLCRTWGHGHDAGVIHKDVEAKGGGEKGVGGFLDGGEGGEVEFEEGDVSGGDLFFDGGDCGFGFGAGSGGKVDVGVAFG